MRSAACAKVFRGRVEHTLARLASIYTADNEHAAGRLGALETLYDTVTKDVISKVDRVVPVSKAEYQDDKAAAAASFEAYKNETTSVINALVGKLNSLTPVRSLILLCTT